MLRLGRLTEARRAGGLNPWVDPAASTSPRAIARRRAEAVLLLLRSSLHDQLDARARLRGVTEQADQRHPRGDRGPDIVASASGDAFVGQSADLAALKALTDAPGVRAFSGPYPLIGAELEAKGVTAREVGGQQVGGAGVWAQGRDPAAAAVDQPEVTEGGWVRDGGVIVEAGFADALELSVGDEITLQTRVCGLMIRGEQPDCRVVNRRSFEVAGVAVTAAARPYPGVCFGRDCPEIAEAIEGQPLDDSPVVEPAVDAETRYPDRARPGPGRPTRTPAVSHPRRQAFPMS